MPWYLLRTLANTCLPTTTQAVIVEAVGPMYWMPGIMVVMDLWGTEAGGMFWLDGKSGCQGGCNLSKSTVTSSNFKLGVQYQSR